MVRDVFAAGAMSLLQTLPVSRGTVLVMVMLVASVLYLIVELTGTRSSLSPLMTVAAGLRQFVFFHSECIAQSHGVQCVFDDFYSRLFSVI